jgi:hypothetical protein
MRLTVDAINMKGGYAGDVTFEPTDVTDETGKKVGFVEASRSPASRHISLFAGKYQGEFRSREECDAFAKGVEAVLNHMMATEEKLPAPLANA